MLFNTKRGRIMKIVISAVGMTLDSAVDPRFGRAACLLIVDSETGTLLEAIDNSTGRDAAHGAGIGAAALVADKGVAAILTGHVGPKAMPIVEKAGIQVVSDVSGTVGEAVEKFRSGAQGQTQSGAASSTPSSAPGGKCRGCGGGGQGKGQGQGGGRGSGSGGGRGQNRK
jgi:predicted Fe-Mo cluster-binding NifX family protein